MSASTLRTQRAGFSPASHHTSRAPGFAADAKAPVTPRDRDMSDYLDAARVRLGIQKKELAFWWGCDHSYVSRVLSPDAPDKLTDELMALLVPDADRTDDRADDRSTALYVAMLEEACAGAGLLTGKKAAAAKAIEGVAAMLDCDRLNVPLAMAKVEMR